MVLSPITRNQIEEKFGKPLRYPSDYDALSIDIKVATGERISINTLKRLTGAIDDVKEPRLSTLDIIAKYLGFNDWDVYIKNMSDDGNSSFGKDENSIDQKDLPIGCKVEFHYNPGRKVVLHKDSDMLFCVDESFGSKLRINDRMEIGSFHLHYPLFSKNVTRGTEMLGPFTAGKISGLTYLKIIK